MRPLVLWCPDWPVRAGLPDLPRDVPGAVMAGGQVLACNHAARLDGVRRGMRRRDAQARCPGLALADHRPDVEARAFEEVLLGVEELSPAVTPLRPGLCALPVPARFYGGEQEAAAVVAERVVSLAVWDVRLGVADSLFAAEQAARRAAPQSVHVVEPGADAAFLAPLPVEVLDAPEVVSLLRRMGIGSLAQLAALEPTDVHTRFGTHGSLLHRLASGRDPRPLARRQVPPELGAVLTLEPPVSSAETVAFSLRSVAEAFVARLADQGLVCTGLGIEVDVDDAVASTRRWVHPRWFDAVDVVDRVRWQLQGGQLPGPVGAVRLVPETVAPVGEHAQALFGAGASTPTDERVQRGIARVQGLVGHEGVLAARVQGGRAPAARRLLTPWGEQGQAARVVAAPWPGSVPPPAPATVYAAPRPAQVVGAGDRVVGVDGRGAISCPPVRFRASGDDAWRPVASWAGPWPVDELWWDEAAARRVARFQVVGVDGTAWLMVVEDGTWWTEARYD